MKISIFTPFHKKDTSYLREAHDSVMRQTHADWEWVILLNGEGLDADLGFMTDQRIKLVRTTNTGKIGELKKECCLNCAGDIFAELDYDDILTRDCLEEVERAFEDDRVQFAYSNSCEFHDGTWFPNTYSEYWGWRTRTFSYEDGVERRHLVEMVSWEPSPQMMRRIEWAPNHIRCWRRSAYHEIGGHDEKLTAADDHDLCCRTYIRYGAEGMRLIDKCLYLYRVHPVNNVKLLNQEIQNQTHRNYLNHTFAMAERWSDDNKLRKIDLGGRFGAWKGYETVDLLDADIIMDLNGKWHKLEDDSVGVLKAHHIFEHLKDPIHAFNEAYRVLAPGGFLLLEVPSTDGRGAWQDPTHISFFNENSLWYYTNDFYAKFIRPMYKGRFQVARKITWFPDEFHKNNNISILQADLICLKPPYSDRQVGEKLI